MSIPSGDELKVLLTTYEICAREITRYRDYEWRITAWTTVVLVGISAAASGLGLTLQANSGLQVIMTIIAIVVCGFGAWHLHFAHVRRVDNWSLRRR